jgi:gliding motility-associated protein GldM
MALPKEPRQKMINLMYLVLTALLALNVSNEILNAFKTVDNSLINSNGVIVASNNFIASSLNEQGKKPELAAKVAIWKPKADEAIAMANAMAAYIENLKDTLKYESGLHLEDGVEVFKEDDLDAATRMMDTRGEGPKLHQALEDYVKKLSALIPPELKAKTPKFPIDLTTPKTKNLGSNTWTSAYFRMTPTVAGLTILSKFQNDVLRSGNLVAEFCQNQIGKVEVVLDKFEILTSQNSSYLLPGQTLEIKAGIGAFSSAAKPTISIGGVSQVANDSGFARYKTTIGGGGGGNIPVSVSFKDPNTGQTITKNTTVSYTVGQPSGASIFLEKMNVMYADVDNPITVSSGTGKAEKMSLSFSAGSVTSAGGGGKYRIKPTTQGPATVTVSVEGKAYPFPIRVKQLPDPVPMVGTQSGGKVAAAQFKAMGGLRAQLKDSEFEFPFAIVSYTMAGNGAGFQSYTPAQINGAQWGGNPVITQCKPGSTVFFDDIIVRGPGGKTRKLPSIAFQLQ